MEKLMKKIGDFYIQDEDTFFQFQYDRGFPMDGSLHRDILNKMKPSKEIKALNEMNPCVNSLGDMWDTCDANICNQRCADAIKKSFTTMSTNDCSNLVTGMDGDKKIKMKMENKKVKYKRRNYKL